MSFASLMASLSPSAWYRLGEASGTTMTDSSGNSRHGTYNGSGVGYGATSLLVGDSDTCIDFDGAAGAGTIADAAWMDGSTLSIHTVINADVVTGTTLLVERDNPEVAAGRDWQFRINAGKLEFFFWDTGGTLRGVYANTTTLSTGTTYRVGVTYDGTTVRFYLNGVADGTASISAGIRASTIPIQVARHFGTTPGGSLWFNGRMDELGIWVGTALTAQNMADLNTAATTAPTQYAAAGTVAATSATTSTAAVLRAAASGTAAATSATASSAAGFYAAASGSAASTSAVTGAATSRLVASGTVAATSGVTGSAGISQDAAGIVEVVSGVTGEADRSLAAGGTVEVVSDVSGDVIALLVAAGTAEALSAMLGDVTLLAPASGVVEVVSDVRGAATVPQPPVDTPPARTLTVGLDVRTLVIAADNRLLTVGPDNRVLVVSTETRTVGVTQ